MKKIDLHVHTKNIKSYDEGHSRDIAKKEFDEKINEANVGYLAITNHNSFDLEQYNNFSTNDNFIVFPGIELDIKINEKDETYKNINVIVSPSFAKDLSEITSEWSINRKQINGFDELKETFDRLNPIYYCDHKSNEKRKFTKEEIRELSKTVENPVIADFNNKNTKIVLGFDGIEGLIGSDNLEWDSYVQKSEKLGTIHWKISSFEELYRLLKNGDKNIIKELMNKKEEKEFIINIDGDDNFIKTYSGLNVIFGGKGTGKTKILEGIKNKIELDGTKVSYYKASDKEDEFKNIFPIRFNVDINSLEEYKFISNSLLKIKDWNENNININSIKTFYDAAHDSAIDKFKILETEIINSEKPNDGLDFIEVNKYINKLNSIFNDTNINLEFISSEIKILLDEFNKIQEKIKFEYLKLNKDYFNNQHVNNFLESIKKTLLEGKGLRTYPNKIGLYDTWSNRNNFKNECLKIINFKNIKYNIKYLTKIFIPDREKTIQYLNIIKPFSGDETIEWKNIDKIKASTNKPMKELITLLENVSNSINIPSIFDIINIQNIISNYSIIDKNFIMHTGGIYEEKNINGKKEMKRTELSDGEKAVALLLKKLDFNVDYILLDEPSTFLGGNITKTLLIPTIKKLNKAGKNIIIATHDSNIAINCLPINMIYRKKILNNENDKNFITINGNWWSKKFEIENDFTEIVTNNFEGGIDAFNLRKDIYNDDFKN